MIAIARLAVSMTALCALVGVSASAVRAPSAKSAAASSSYVQAAFAVRQDARDIRVVDLRKGATRFSVRAFAQRAIAAASAELAPFTRRQTVVFVSAGGPYLSFRSSIEDYGEGARPATLSRYWTVDVTRAGQPAFDRAGQDLAPASGPSQVLRITDLFSANEVLRALAASPQVRAVVTDAPKELGAFVEAWRTAAQNVPAGSMAACYLVNDDWASSFAIVSADATAVKARLLLADSRACEPGRAVVDITISAPLPNRVRVTAAPARPALRFVLER